MFLTLYYIIMVYGRFRRTRKGSGAYGRKRSITRRRRATGFKKVAKPRFALSGYRRNIEKKYYDKTFSGNSIELKTGPTAANADVNNGFMYTSSTWKGYSFGGTMDYAAQSNDLNKGLSTGTTTRSRIGNKIKPIYYRGAFTFNAAMVAPGVQEQGGEAFASATAVGNYLRTTYRMALVKDLQVNSTENEITWNHVFDTAMSLAGVHSELKVENMGRFIVLEDKVFTLDAQSPQKTCQFMISGSKMGAVRFNGPGYDSLTDKGLYIIYAAFVSGVAQALTSDGITLPCPVGNTRLCFTDE